MQDLLKLAKGMVKTPVADYHKATNTPKGKPAAYDGERVQHAKTLNQVINKRAKK